MSQTSTGVVSVQWQFNSAQLKSEDRYTTKQVIIQLDHGALVTGERKIISTWNNKVLLHRRSMYSLVGEENFHLQLPCYWSSKGELPVDGRVFIDTNGHDFVYSIVLFANDMELYRSVCPTRRIARKGVVTWLPWIELQRRRVVLGKIHRSVECSGNIMVNNGMSDHNRTLSIPASVILTKTRNRCFPCVYIQKLMMTMPQGRYTLM